MRHAKALMVLSAVMILSLWGSVAVAQVYAGEGEPGWIVSYEGALGTVVNPDIEVPGVRGMTIDEFGRLLIAAYGDQGDVLLFDVDGRLVHRILGPVSPSVAEELAARIAELAERAMKGAP